MKFTETQIIAAARAIARASPQGEAVNDFFKRNILHYMDLASAALGAVEYAPVPDSPQGIMRAALLSIARADYKGTVTASMQAARDALNKCDTLGGKPAILQCTPPFTPEGEAAAIVDKLLGKYDPVATMRDLIAKHPNVESCTWSHIAAGVTEVIVRPRKGASIRWQYRPVNEIVELAKLLQCL